MYWKNNRFKWIDLLISALIVGIMFWLDKSKIVDLECLKLSKDYYVVLAGIAASLLGFLIAALAVMISLMSEAKAKLLQKGGHTKNILSVYNSTHIHLAILTLLCLLGVAYPKLGENVYFSIAVVFYTLTSSFRIQKSVMFLLRVLSTLKS